MEERAWSGDRLAAITLRARRSDHDLGRGGSTPLISLVCSPMNKLIGLIHTRH